MKIIIYLFIAVLTISTSTSQTTQKNDSVVNYLDINKKKQGKWVKPYDNEKTAYEAFFINDIPVGEYNRYYYSGKIKAKINYSQDKSGKGKAVLYWESGVKMAEGNYINIKVKDGVWKMYGTDGALMVQITYSNGKKNGEEIKYFRPKTPSEVITWKNDVKNGIWRQYYQNGRTRLETIHKNGYREGIFQMFYESGRYYVKGRYIGDLRNGKWDYYDKSGEIWKTIEYKNGRATNESEIGLELTKQLDKWEKEKGTIPEPSVESIMNGGR